MFSDCCHSNQWMLSSKVWKSFRCVFLFKGFSQANSECQTNMLLSIICLHLSCYYYCFCRLPGGFTSLPLLSTLESLYIIGILPLELYNSVLHNYFGLSHKFPFLVLLLTSIYCAVGVTYCWLKFYWITLHDKSKQKQS